MRRKSRRSEAKRLHLEVQPNEPAMFRTQVRKQSRRIWRKEGKRYYTAGGEAEPQGLGGKPILSRGPTEQAGTELDINKKGEPK